MNSKTLASLILSSASCAYASGAAAAAPAVSYPAAFTVGVGAVPAGVSMLLWAPLLALTFGCLLWLVVLVARQPREETKSAPATTTVESLDPGESQYEMQKAA